MRLHQVFYQPRGAAHAHSHMQHPLPQPDHLAGHGDFPGGIHRQMQHVRPLQRVTLLHPQSQRVLAGQLQPAAQIGAGRASAGVFHHLAMVGKKQAYGGHALLDMPDVGHAP